MKVVKFTVTPRIPKSLEPLQEMAYNLWISWNYEAINLFIRLDYDAWIKSNQNPVKMLGLVSQERLAKIANDDSFLAALNDVYEKFLHYLKCDTWYKGEKKQDVIAYFSMEYSLDISLPIYSGGLGVLSGDHMKSASDLGLPLVGLGLLYKKGYFMQYLNMDGFQQEAYHENDWYSMPVKQKMDKNGHPVKVAVEIGDTQIVVLVWEVVVGRNSLFLLDTNTTDNAPENRDIAALLYGGGKENRIKQEILLGIGGLRALYAMGYNPIVTHMNEGHSVFLGLERIRRLMKENGLTFEEALQAIWPTNIFTTHTPVPAGNERFTIDVMEKYFKRITEDLGLSWQDFLAFGRENPDNTHESFCLTVLALKLSAYNNGVSKLHGEVSRNMWKTIWKDLPVDEVPIDHITNGVHPRTWLAPNMSDLLNKYMDPWFTDEPTKLDIWERIDGISDEELWRTHERRREQLVAFAREKLKAQQAQRSGGLADHVVGDDALSPYNLTISFARRFATYKRANLIMKDPDRLIRLLSDEKRPIQLIFAGKAHPEDIPGKEIIKEIIHFANKHPNIRSKVIFLENYDFTLGRYLTSGSDIWLNTPRRPLEASGTSGMKAGINGVLNLSVLDGWWDEAYTPDIGWAIGKGEEYIKHELQDEIESKALYDLLEREIIPMFYTRGRDNLPHAWIKKMKASMKMIGENFSSHRMLLDYSNRFYLPAIKNHKIFSEDNYKTAKETALYINKLKKDWNKIKILDVASPSNTFITAGEEFTVNARIELNGTTNDKLHVELYYGALDTDDQIRDARRFEMNCQRIDDNIAHYSITVKCVNAGRQGYSIRILPKNPSLIHPFLPNLVMWE